MAEMTVWDVIRNITEGDQTIPLEQFPIDKYYARFVTSVLAQDPNLIPFVFNLNNYSCFSNRARYVHYLALFHTIPKSKRWIQQYKVQDKYDKELIEAFSKVYDVSDKTAIHYIDLLTEDERKLVLNTFINERELYDK